MEKFFPNKKTLFSLMALLLCLSIVGCENSNNMVDELEVVEKIKQSNVGDYVQFGLYEQDGDTSNGKEKIDWQVIAKEEDKVLLITKYAIECQKYNTEKTNVTWETCSLRQWLNWDFINKAFSEEQQKLIAVTTVSVENNPYAIVSTSNTTQDKVFILSASEVEEFFSSNSARQCEVTTHAAPEEIYSHSSNMNTCWWLRTPGPFPGAVAYVAGDGTISSADVYVPYYTVRPAIWIGI